MEQVDVGRGQAQISENKVKIKKRRRTKKNDLRIGNSRTNKLAASILKKWYF